MTTKGLGLESAKLEVLRHFNCQFKEQVWLIEYILVIRSKFCENVLMY
jgi:hypothetical protein